MVARLAHHAADPPCELPSPVCMDLRHLSLEVLFWVVEAMKMVCLEWPPG
jgi:hypothetical protein